MQFSLFQKPTEEVPVIEAGDRDGLRDYQRERVTQCLDLLQTHRSTVMVLHCGAGKTRTASAIVKHWSGNVLWLAHRDFLCTQARKELVGLTREFVGLEKAEWSSSDERIIVASVQTLRGPRLKKFSPERFALIVIDEAHHATAASYRAILDYFTSAKVLLITATPKRSDKIGLHNVAESHCTPFGIQEGLAWGSFVPVDPRSEFIDDIHLESVGITAGDLAQGELESQIVRSAAPIAQLSAKHMEDRPTIIYTPGVASAHAVAATLREMGLTAVSVDADTEDKVRTNVLIDFKEGKVQYVVNCGIYTEGLDVPSARGIVIARPTKSESLYIQMAGRGGRPAAHVGSLGSSVERVRAIHESAKPNFRLLDITGHAGRHTLCTGIDVLGGESLGAAKAIVKKRIEAGEEVTDLGKALEEAERTVREEEEANRKRIAGAAARASVKSRESTFDPLRLGYDERQTGEAPVNAKEPVNQAEEDWLKMNGLPWRNMTKGAYAKLRNQARQWAKDGKATWKMRKQLEKYGFPVDLTFGVAGKICQHIRESHWRPDADVVRRIIGAT